MFRIRKSTLRGTVLAALVLVVAGCSGGGGDPPTSPGGSSLTQNDADDLAVQAVIAMGPWGTMIEASSGVSSPSSLPTSPRTSGFRLDSAMGGIPTWYDTTLIVGNLTITLSRRYYDLFGDSQDAPSSTTDSVFATSRVAGSVSDARFDATYGQTGWIGIGGINPALPTLHIDGQSSDTLTTHFSALYQDLERFCESRASTTLNDVAWVKPNGSPTYPASGTATIALAWTRFTDGSHGTIEKSANATIVITFNGTATPNVVVNGTWHYQWNLDTGEVVRAGGA